MRYKIKAPTKAMMDKVQAYLDQNDLQVFVVSEQRFSISADLPTQEVLDDIERLGAVVTEDPMLGGPDNPGSE